MCTLHSQRYVGADIAGHRGYFLKGVGVLLNQAIINLGLHFLEKKGTPPLRSRKEVHAICGST
jgi:seryl-tRNA synthetase